jgi:hypothetical protein
LLMGSLGQKLDPKISSNLTPNIGPPTPAAEERDSSRLIIVIAVGAVLAIMLLIAFLMRASPKAVQPASPYITSLKLSDFKMSAAENFIGATVTYIEGTVTNSSDKTMTHAMVEITFKDQLGQVAQREELPLSVLKTTGAYPDPVDLSVSPLKPGESQSFRLTFEGISAQWNRQYPEIRVTDVTVK